MEKRGREMVDRLFKGLIRLSMLTGVTFLVTACYGPNPNYTQEQEEEVEQIEQALEDSIKQ